MYSDEDNGGILPVHNIGVSATGKIPSGALGLHWVAEVANGRSSLIPDIPVQNFRDDSNGKAVNLAVYARPGEWNGFQAGFSYYRNTLHPVDLAPIDQSIFTTHVVYVGSRLEWLNEAAIVRHALHGEGQVFRNLTSYTQFSYGFGKTRPYFRYDYENLPASDPIFGHIQRLNGPSVGVNRHLSNYVILKAQYGRLAQRDLSSANAFQAQIAFAF